MRIRLPSTRIRQILNVLNPLPRGKGFECAKNLESCDRSNPDILKTDDVTNSDPVFTASIFNMAAERNIIGSLVANSHA